MNQKDLLCIFFAESCSIKHEARISLCKESVFGVHLAEEEQPEYSMQI